MRSGRGRNITRLVEKVARAHQATKREVVCELYGEKDHVTFDPKCYWQQAGGHPRAHHITKRKLDVRIVVKRVMREVTGSAPGNITQIMMR